MAKVGLTIGINNYPGTGSDLSGCVNDANDWAAELQGRGFDVSGLTDALATKANMVKAMSDLVTSLEYQDIGVITYSGHGTWYPDEDGDEKDRRDEAICPYDIFRGNPITDDELFEIFTQRTYGSRLVFISDSCHSGTIERYAPALGVPPSRDPNFKGKQQRVRFLPPMAWLDDDAYETRLAMEYAEHAAPRGKSRTSALTLTGCKDTEYSYDAWFNNRPNGAFTYVALRALQDIPANAPFFEWHRAIRSMLPSIDYPQTPQLNGTSVQKRWPILESSNKKD